MSVQVAAVGNVEGRERSLMPRLLLVVLAATFLLHLLVVAEPFGRDQGIFGYIAQTILRGGVPYRDAWDHKPPGLYAVYALAFALFGQAMPSVHLMEGIALMIGAFFLYLVSRRLHGDAVGLLGALLYGVSATLLFEWWDRGQAEIYMGITGTIAVYALLRGLDTRGNLAILACGFFCGLTVCFKPSGIFLVAGLGLALFLFYRPVNVRDTAGVLGALAIGFSTSFIPLLAYFAANGALNDLYQAVIVFNTYHARIGGNPTLAGIVTGTLDFLASMNFLTPLALVGLWAVLKLPTSIPSTAGGTRVRVMGRVGMAAVIMPIWLLASAAGIWTQGKFFSYHWSPVLPPLALLAAWGITLLAREIRQARGNMVRALIAAVCLAVAAIYATALVRDHAPKWTRDAGYLLGHTTSEQYLANFAHNIEGRDVYSFLETQQTAQYLREHSSADDRVLIWGFQALVNFLADRRAPTRYIFTYPLTFDRPESAFRVEARRTFLRDLRNQPPLYIVLVTNDVNPLQAVDSYSLLAGFPEFQQVIRQQYRLERDIGDFHLYRRIDA